MYDKKVTPDAERVALLRKMESLGLYEANLEIMLNLTERDAARRPRAY